MPIRKEIVIINQDSGYLMIDIANAFAADGWNCCLVAGRLVERDTPLNDTIEFIKIIRYVRKTITRRLVTWSVAFFQILFIVLFKHRGKHLFIVSNPPIALLLPLFCRNTYSLLIFDIYPDVLTEMGVIGINSCISRIWAYANRIVYKRAEQIYTITNGMKIVLEKYCNDKSVKMIPLWTNSKHIKPVDKDKNPFVLEHGLYNKFVVLYSGNIGYSSNIDIILDLASNIISNEIIFVIIGEGAKKINVYNRIIKENITNCILLPWQEVNMLPYALSSASLSIVSLGNGASNLAIPSKLFDYLSVGSPVLGIAHQSSDLSNIINEYKVGKSFEPKQISEMTKFIYKLESDVDLQEKLKNNSLNASSHFTSANASCFIMS